MPKTTPTTTTAPKTPAKTAAAPKKTTKKDAAPAPAVETVPPPTPAPVPTPDAAGDADAAADGALSEQTTAFFSKLQQMMALMTAMKVEFRALEKAWGREVKTLQKKTGRSKRKSGNRAPSGFTKPTLISNELADFIKQPHVTEMARTDVTKEINKYIRANNLQDKENGRKIVPDKSLSTLLKLTKDDQLTYFNLQKYMTHHFTKSAKTLEA